MELQEEIKLKRKQIIVKSLVIKNDMRGFNDKIVKSELVKCNFQNFIKSNSNNFCLNWIRVNIHKMKDFIKPRVALEWFHEATQNSHPLVLLFFPSSRKSYICENPEILGKNIPIYRRQKMLHYKE